MVNIIMKRSIVMSAPAKSKMNNKKEKIIITY
jgi:hypothetical protein